MLITILQLMNSNDLIKGFSKLPKEEKIELVASRFRDGDQFIEELKKLQHPDAGIQEKLDNFSENTLANFPMPYGVAPNFLINNENFLIPMVIEESSVVAAASAAARFWYDKGGFKALIKNSLKVGQIHFLWKDKPEKLLEKIDDLKYEIRSGTAEITAKMEKRGGGISGIELVDLTDRLSNVYQLKFNFRTADSMGANFINSVLEEAAGITERFFNKDNAQIQPVEILMAILSNYTPECIVRVEISTTIKELEKIKGVESGKEFARRFIQAVDIAKNDVYRAVTHNKGIYNGVDAVIMATGNDYRAVEAAGHAYASRKGSYGSLSYADMSEGQFVHGLEIPLALGTVGGLTRIHPLARWSFEILGNPDAETLMMIAASAGLANNFSAVKSLVTVGIQKGHMKMHLDNILAFLGADQNEKERVHNEFRDKTVSHSAVEIYLKKIRAGK